MDDEKIEVIAPLFDRLIDMDPYSSTEPKVLKNYTLPEMRLAVERDISRLLNTRHSQIPHSYHAYVKQLDDKEGLEDFPLLSYGLPDFSKYDVEKLSGQISIEYDVVRLIEQYEPRLKDIEVHLQLTSPPRVEVILYVSGILTYDPSEERFTFPVRIEHFETHVTQKKVT